MKCEPYEILGYDASCSSVHFHHASAAHSSSCLCICDDDSLTRVLVNSNVALGLRLLGNSLSKYNAKQSGMDCCHTHFVLSKEYLPLIGLHFKFDLQSLSYKYWGCNLFLKNPVTIQVVQRLVQSSSLSLQFSSQWLCIGSANLAPMCCDWRTVQADVMHKHQIGVPPVNCNSSSEGLLSHAELVASDYPPATFLSFVLSCLLLIQSVDLWQKCFELVVRLDHLDMCDWVKGSPAHQCEDHKVLEK